MAGPSGGNRASPASREGRWDGRAGKARARAKPYVAVHYFSYGGSEGYYLSSCACFTRPETEVRRGGDICPES